MEVLAIFEDSLREEKRFLIDSNTLQKGRQANVVATINAIIFPLLLSSFSFTSKASK